MSKHDATGFAGNPPLSATIMLLGSPNRFPTTTTVPSIAGPRSRSRCGRWRRVGEAILETEGLGQVRKLLIEASCQALMLSSGRQRLPGCPGEFPLARQAAGGLRGSRRPRGRSGRSLEFHQLEQAGIKRRDLLIEQPQKRLVVRLRGQL